MEDRRTEEPGNGGGPVHDPIPRDMQDQQAGAADEAWEGDVERADRGSGGSPVPETDESGTARREDDAGPPESDESPA